MNPSQLPPLDPPGVGLGIYQAAGLGLVGDYGVADPKRPLGRAAAVIWTIVGVSLVSVFTAALASQLTVQNIQSKITGVRDLSGAKVATVTASSAAAYLTAHAIPFTGVPTINDAYRQLDSGGVDAIVFDAIGDEHSQLLVGVEEWIAHVAGSGGSGARRGPGQSAALRRAPPWPLKVAWMTRRLWWWGRCSLSGGCSAVLTGRR